MLRDRFVLALIAAGLFLVGVFALSLSTSLDAYDRWGFRISCGSGLEADYHQAAAADRTETTGPAATPSPTPAARNDYVGQCRSAVWWRRGWAGLLVLTGAGLATGLLLRWQREAPAERGST